jgi:hypothetical protein
MTPLGIIIAVVGLIAIMGPRKWLYALFLFSVPFSGTSVVNVGAGDTASGLQVWMYFGALILLRDFGAWVLNPNKGLPLPLIKRGALLLMFVAVLAASLVMPEYIGGKLEIDAPGLMDLTSEPLRFGMRNMTSFIYIVFGCLVAFDIARTNITDDEASQTERYYLAAAILTCSLGILEFLAHIFHFPSPTLLFRNSASQGAQGYLGLLSDNLTRVSSVAVEPSILSQYLVTALPLTLTSFLGKGYIYSKRIDRFAFFLIITVLLLTTSSVAYVALLMLPLLCIPVIARLEIYKYKIFWRILAGGFAFVVMLGVLYLVSSSIREVLNLALFAKGESYSSLERLKTITAAWGYFRSYPVLGVGWGSVTSHDLILMILANSGILGLGAFGLAASGIGWLVFRGIKDASHTSDRSRTIWFLSGIFLLFASTISEFPFVFGHLWVVAGMAIAASLRDYREPVLDKIE